MVLVPPRVPAPVARVQSVPVPVLPHLLISVQDAFPLPLTRLIPLPLEGPPPALLSLLWSSVLAEAHDTGVQLEGACAAPPSDVLLGVTEVVDGSHLWWTQTGWRQPAGLLAGGLPEIRWKRKLSRLQAINLFSQFEVVPVTNSVFLMEKVRRSEREESEFTSGVRSPRLYPLDKRVLPDPWLCVQ